MPGGVGGAAPRGAPLSRSTYFITSACLPPLQSSDGHGAGERAGERTPEMADRALSAGAGDRHRDDNGAANRGVGPAGWFLDELVHGTVALDRSDFTGQPNSPRVKFGIQNVKG